MKRTIEGLCIFVERCRIYGIWRGYVEQNCGRKNQRFTGTAELYQRDFCGKVDISAKFLYEIESGEKGFSDETLCRISRVLSVSCDYIMLGEEKGHRGMEKIIYVLETMEPKQRSRMYEVLKMLSDMYGEL